MGIKNTKYEVMPPSYEESISNKNNDNLPNYEELYGSKYTEIDYKLKDKMINYIVDNNINNLTIVSFINRNITYICKKEYI